MSDLHVVVVPVGKLGRADLEPAVTRAARQLKAPMELREPLRVPPGAEDRDRGMHRAALLIERLRNEVPKLGQGELLGSEEPDAPLPFRPDAFIFVTDVDLCTANTDGAIAALVSQRQSAIVSIRRIREAFHKRRADPNKQRSRLVKEIIRMWSRLRGLSACTDARCVMSNTRGLPDLDTKEERFCRNCEQLLHEGKISL